MLPPTGNGSVRTSLGAFASAVRAAARDSISATSSAVSTNLSA